MRLISRVTSCFKSLFIFSSELNLTSFRRLSWVSLNFLSRLSRFTIHWIILINLPISPVTDCVSELNLSLFLRRLHFSPIPCAPHSEESNSWASPTNSAWSVRRVSHSHRLVHTYNVQCTLQPLCYWTIIDLKRIILQAKATLLPLSNADYCNNIHPSPEYTNIQCVQFAIVDWPWFAQQETHCRICIAG